MHRSRNPTDVQFKNAQNGFFFTEFDQIYTTAGGELPLTPLLTALVQLLGLERCFVSLWAQKLGIPGGAIATRRAESTRKCRKRAAVHNYFCSIIFVLYWKRNKCTDDLYHEDKKELIGGQITKNKNKKNQQAPLFGTPFLELMVYNGSNREDSHVVPLFKQDNDAATEMYSF